MRKCRSDLPVLPLLLAALAASSCSSASKNTGSANIPTWIHQPVRTIEAGYIVYIGTGEDKNAERAAFKAEAAALQDLANECSFAPKGTRTEDRFTETTGLLHHGYAKIAVEFRDCEAAKSAINPDDIRKLANAAYSDEIKRYQDLVQHPGDEVAADDDSDGVNEAIDSKSPPPGGGSGVRDSNHLFVVRQWVFYSKQDVILSPPQTYAANSIESTQFVNKVAPAQDQVQTYERNHPEIHSWNNAWSTSPTGSTFRRRMGHSYTSSPASSGRHWSAPHSTQPANTTPPQKKKRRRRRGGWNR
ncbi:MAG: hypothetical protein HY074_02540 [Deltaproteobacteria bacterium]|nr:hypothetical protein [Deltaproteobacteria bacterium]